MREFSQWTKMTRKGEDRSGGGFTYCPKEILEWALKYGGLDPATKDLEVRFFAQRGGKGRGSILMRVRPIKPKAPETPK